VFIEGWFGDDPDKSRVLGLLENHARFDDLTGNPQLLGLCCFAAADGDFDPKSLNRAALFNRHSAPPYPELAYMAT
jgi:hypothetical protein